jgi:hypothetical protein
MKFVNTKSTIFLGTLLVIIALSISLSSCSEVVSKSSSEAKSSIKTKLQNKSKTATKAKIKSQSRVRKEKVYSLQTPPGAPKPATAKAAPAPNAKKENSKPKVETTPADKDVILKDWLMVASRTFKNNDVFPEIFTGYMNTNVRIRTDSYDFRLNDAYKKDVNQNNNPDQEKHFWFRLTKDTIFYSSTKEDLNILGGNKISQITFTALLKKHELGYFCFTINDKSGHDWKICSEVEKTTNIWFCTIQKLRGQKLDNFCSRILAGLRSGSGSGTGSDGDDANIVYRNVNNYFKKKHFIKFFINFFLIILIFRIKSFFN